MPARRTLVRDVQATPAQLRALAAQQPADFPVLFDSAAAAPLGRYSLLMAYPRATLQLRGDGSLLQGDGTASRDDFLGTLDAWWRAVRTPVADEPLPFSGGWVVYLAYEFATQIEPGLRLPALPADAPCAYAMRVPAALIYDHEHGRCVAMAEAGEGALLERLCATVARLAAVEASCPALPAHASLTEQDPQHYRDAVLRAQEYIARGDVYQANLSRGWRLEFATPPDPAALYERLRAANPAPFAALARLPGLTLLSSSPERLVCVRDGMVQTRPIAGTRPRRGGADALERSTLLANPKERAEHVMLIDLERNDLGRICLPGSVEVSEFMVTESYPHVHHIVSNVRGQLRDDVGPGATLRAVFPGGTITGCPKYRCMQVIGELEGEPRGAYTGSLGYINRDGSMDFSILIRTATLQGRQLEFRAGAGVVADSDWQQELDETRAKAQGMVRAFGAPP